jgi:hypothetical protein
MKLPLKELKRKLEKIKKIEKSKDFEGKPF